MRFRLASRSVVFDALELIRSNFLGISQIWEATTAKQMKIDLPFEEELINSCR